MTRKKTRLLARLLLTWVFGHKNRAFQHGWATYHTNNRAQQWCKNNFRSFVSKETWPPNSPELNPMDYSIWIKVSSHMEYGKILKMNNLRREIEKAIKKIDIYYTREAIGAFLRRMHSLENRIASCSCPK